MTSKYEVENLLRPPVEVLSGLSGATCATVCGSAPELMLMSPEVGYAAAALFGVGSFYRFRQARTVLRYQRHIKRLPRFSMKADDIPTSEAGLYLGRGFEWRTQHTERLNATFDSRNEKYIRPHSLYRKAREWEYKLTHAGFNGLARVLATDSILNPVRPDPDVGGTPALHGVGMDRETDVYQAQSTRNGHTVVVGTTRVGKSRNAELFITQDIHRKNSCVFVLDPKGDAALLQRCYIEAVKAGKGNDFWFFHLGYPEKSCKYNAVGSFARITEIPTRLTGNLPESGDAKSFKDFAWQFTKFIAIAEVRLGDKPSYKSVKRHLRNIDGLFRRYAEHYLTQNGYHYKDYVATAEPQQQGKKKRDPRAAALAAFIRENDIYEQVLNDLLYMFEMDREYYGKISIQLGPVLEKLTTGRIGEILSPEYDDPDDDRKTIDFQEIIKRGGICYIGLDALTDPEVAAAVGEAMFSELTSLAGYIYNYGLDGDSPCPEEARPVVDIHGDEFSDLIGPKFATLINKSGGAGYRLTLYTQTLSDIQARLESEAKAGQIIGNINNVIMMRVQEFKTAELLTKKLPEVKVREHISISGYQDTADSHKYISTSQDRTQETQRPLLNPADIMSLPKGQAFALMDGNRLFKIRAPLPAEEKGVVLPNNLEAVVDDMKERYSKTVDWQELRDAA